MFSSVFDTTTEGGAIAVEAEVALLDKLIEEFPRNDEACQLKQQNRKLVPYQPGEIGNGACGTSEPVTFRDMDAESEDLDNGEGWGENKKKRKKGGKMSAVLVSDAVEEVGEEEEEEEEGPSARDVFLAKTRKEIRAQLRQQALRKEQHMLHSVEELYDQDPKKAVKAAASFIASIKGGGDGEDKKKRRR